MNLCITCLSAAYHTASLWQMVKEDGRETLNIPAGMPTVKYLVNLVTEYGYPIELNTGPVEILAVTMFEGSAYCTPHAADAVYNASLRRG